MKSCSILRFTLLCSLLLGVAAGCTNDNTVSTVHPEGQVVAEVVGEWDCVQQVNGEFEVDQEIDDLFLNSQGSGSYVMMDGSDGNLEWACKDGRINFVGFQFAKSMSYSVYFEDRLTLTGVRDSLNVTLVFLRME